MIDLSGKVALVTGAAGTGIGRGTAQAFGAVGATVIVTARRLEAAAEVADAIVAEGGKAVPVVLDAGDSASCRAAIAQVTDRFGRLDILVHNATHGYSAQVAPIDAVEADWWDPQMAVSLAGSHYLAREAFPWLKASGDGRLILFSSIRGVAGLDANPAYAVVKAAVRGLMRSLAHEWGPHGITVNAITPAAISQAALDYFDANPGTREHVEALIPLRRMGDPRHDVGAGIVGLAGPTGRYLTGQTFYLDGGIWSAT